MIDIEELIKIGAEVGLKPQDIYDMELWEFNNYIKGYKRKIYNDQKNLMTLAWYTGYFANPYNKKKSLDHYLNKLTNKITMEENKNKPVDTKWSKIIHQRIQEMKKQGGHVISEHKRN